MPRTLPRAVDRAAERDPARPAMRFGGRSLSYAELAADSNRLGHALRDVGVRRGDRVGILAGKGLVAGTAIHGIMKAGAAYVPLDPGAPLERNARIVVDGGIRTVVAEPTARARLGDLAAASGLEAAVGVEGIPDLDTVPWGEVEACPAGRPAIDLEKDDLAYVLYTSGSTGRPKGVAHTHASALAFAEVALQTYGFTPEDRLTNHAPLQFDLSTMDYFSAAVAGATTVIVPEVHTKLPASLSRLLEVEQVSVLYMVPFALTQLLLHGALEQRDLSSVRWVLFGGEPFAPKYVRALMELLPQATFCNVYGPTEVNGVTYWIVPPIPPGSEEPIPIGRPYERVEAVVVDSDDRAVPRGETGELHIRSPTMMKGYWGRPDLDEAVFASRRSAEGRDATFFRTGDMVRETEPGVFEFLGRGDRQIKTRGYRVELDEVEAALLRHEAVEAVAVYPVPDGGGSQSIEACAVVASGALAGVDDLLDHLRAVLPGYAVPARLDLVEELPRTSTDKIDRVELRSRAIARRGGEPSGARAVAEGPRGGREGT